MNLMGKPPQLETNAPSCVECTLFRLPEQRTFLFSCLNLPMELPPLPLYDLEFRLRLPEGVSVQSVLFGPDGEKQDFRQDGVVLHIALKRMQDFAFFRIHYVEV